MSAGRERGEIAVVADAAALAETVAEAFAESAAAAIAARGVFTVALAGGSTPKAAYDVLAARYARDVTWDRIRFFFGDERCVGPEDPESNYGMARDRLLAPLGIDGSTVARMRGEDDPAVAAAAYATLLRERLGEAPRFDLVMLGMGPDGHTASLFPGGDPYEDDAALVRAPFVAKVGAHRLTLTPHAINGAREIAVATAGEAKAEALGIALDGAFDPRRTPIQTLAPREGRLRWFVDRAAAARLSSI